MIRIRIYARVDELHSLVYIIRRTLSSTADYKTSQNTASVDIHLLSSIGAECIRRRMDVRFTQSLDPDIYSVLNTVAKGNGISIQKLLETVVIPDWMRIVSTKSRKNISKRAS
jgi:hypothetical protein